MFCGKSNKINSSGEYRSGKRGPPAFNVNTRVALSCLHAGIGQTHINNVLATIDIPPLDCKTVVFFANASDGVGPSSNERSGASVKTARENGERH